jgi:ribA/ribD-fused uncharacterized protein
MTTIDRFTGDHEFLSNYYASPIEVDGILYATVEHAFHAAKTLKLDEKRGIAAAATPGDAKRMGRLVEARADWEEVKVGIMEDLVRLKFGTHSSLREMLLATGDAQLIEGNWWKDTFWGVCRGAGRNELGKILMRVRAELAKG